MAGFRKPQKILRRTGGGFDHRGNHIDPSETEIKILASVQPLNADDREQYSSLVDAGATKGLYLKLYTKTQLFAAQEGRQGLTATEADILVWSGRRYAVMQVEPWQSGIISHYKAILAEVPETNEQND